MSTRNRVITHPAFRFAYASLEGFLANAYCDNGQARCALLSGPARCGKTTLSEMVANLVATRPLPPRKGDPCTERRRAIFVETPAAATQKSLAETILIAAGDPVTGRLSQAQLRNRLVGLLQDLDVELLILDDVHHLITTGKRAQAAEIAEFVKSFLNAGICPILLVGVDPVSTIVTSNAQLDGRCWCQPTLLPFGWSTKKEQAAFSRLLHELAKVLQVTAAFDAGGADFAERMHLASGGAIGLVTLLNDKALAVGSRQGANVLTLDTYAEAYDDWVGGAARWAETPDGEVTRTRARNPFR